ncbi:hypothetical protein LPB19_09250 [Marinobacter salinisoli]|uniref:Tetratricopeptide repeat protein n=1 Tax=Marinobacter salinisoli TaxID=2769486 RepID=A0ABX7MMH3_9GAMM|nr:hypothetical protein [Marinobacter salinisoli]QSP93415.1 hypothetical protein LPB19_09250 [Marinobacter salinisoli]
MAVAKRKSRHPLRGLVLITALMAGQAFALAPEHEMRRLMLATEEAVESENWGDAGEYLNRLQQLEGNKPADYFYFRGLVMYQAKHLNEAQSALETYVNNAGTDGDNYQQALKLITEVEKARSQTPANGAGGGEAGKIAVIEPAGGQRINSLRELYLVDSDREALVMHLNSLLEVAGWREDQTIVKVDQPADVQYRIGASADAVSIQEIRRNADDQVVRKAQSLPVFGVNPQIQWGCESTVGACWVYDPRDGSRLLQLSQNRDQTREIARTLGQLIRNLQTPTGS